VRNDNSTGKRSFSVEVHARKRRRRRIPVSRAIAFNTRYPNGVVCLRFPRRWWWSDARDIQYRRPLERRRPSLVTCPRRPFAPRRSGKTCNTTAAVAFSQIDSTTRHGVDNRDYTTIRKIVHSLTAVRMGRRIRFSYRSDKRANKREPLACVRNHICIYA